MVVDEVQGERKHIPVGSVACIMLEPGTRISHAAVKLAAATGTLLIWVGEAGVRLYASGQPGGARSDRLLYQASLALDEGLRLKVVRKMFEIRFGEPAPGRRSVDQLRGIEGARVRKTYQLLAQQYGVEWHGRRYDPSQWDKTDIANQCLSAATSCLYGVTEAAVLAAGYAPAVGFIHSGKPLSFVYDIADLFKFDTVVPWPFALRQKDLPHRIGKFAWPAEMPSGKRNCSTILSPPLKRCWPPVVLNRRSPLKIVNRLPFPNQSPWEITGTGASNEYAGGSNGKRPSSASRPPCCMAPGNSCWCIRW